MFRYVIQLPFRLRLDEKYAFPLLKVKTSVVIRFVNPPVKQGEPLQNALLLMDSNKKLEEDPDWMLQAFHYVNDIIRAYQVVTKSIFDNGIISQLTWNQFGCILQFAEIDEDGRVKGNARTYYANISLGSDPVSRRDYEKIKVLAESPKLMSRHTLEEFLIRARTFEEQHNFRMAVLETVIALEFALYLIVRNYAKSKGMGEEQTKNLISGLSLSAILNALARFCDRLPDAKIIDGCWKANSVRNRIVHQGCLDVTGEQAQQALASVESFINHFKSQIEHALSSME